jgi:hypothetical protein
VWVTWGYSEKISSYRKVTKIIQRILYNQGRLAIEFCVSVAMRLFPLHFMLNSSLEPMLFFAVVNFFLIVNPLQL